MIKVLELKTSRLFDLDFANNTILSWFFFIFLINDLGFLIPAIIANKYNILVELVIPIRIPIKEVKAEIKRHAVIAEAKIRKCSI